MTVRVTLPLESSAAEAAEALGYYPEQLAADIEDPAGIHLWHPKNNNSGELYLVEGAPNIVLRRQSTGTFDVPYDPDGLNNHLRSHAAELAKIAARPNLAVAKHYVGVATRPGESTPSVFTVTERLAFKPVIRTKRPHALNQDAWIDLFTAVVPYYAETAPYRRALADLSKHTQWSKNQQENGEGGQQLVFTLVDLDAYLARPLRELCWIEADLAKIHPLSLSGRALRETVRATIAKKRQELGLPPAQPGKLAPIRP